MVARADCRHENPGHWRHGHARCSPSPAGCVPTAIDVRDPRPRRRRGAAAVRRELRGRRRRRTQTATLLPAPCATAMPSTSIFGAAIRWRVTPASNGTAPPTLRRRRPAAASRRLGYVSAAGIGESPTARHPLFEDQGRRRRCRRRQRRRVHHLQAHSLHGVPAAVRATQPGHHHRSPAAPLSLPRGR